MFQKTPIEMACMITDSIGSLKLLLKTLLVHEKFSRVSGVQPMTIFNN